MKILFLDSPAFAKLDMIEAFEANGIACRLFLHDDYKERKSDAFSSYFSDLISEYNYDFVFSFNYYPVLSLCCNEHHIKYVSYVYDSPQVALYSYTLINPCNYVFLFDKATYDTFKNAGINTVFYLPLAANVTRLMNMKCPSDILPKVTSDISFVGSLYNEEHNFYERLNGISEYTKGYLDSIMTVQQKIYGSFLLEDLLTPDIISDISKACPYKPMPDGTESLAYVYANYFLCRKITSNERIALLKRASKNADLHLYTHQPSYELTDATFIGPIDYYDAMPYVFQNSKINLNITLKSIQTGIPLRCMDIMGCGGFLLSNFQSDMLDYFVPDEDFVYYESEDDFSNKISYYLSHEKEREQIAANALGKMRDYHTFHHRVNEILDIIA